MVIGGLLPVMLTTTVLLGLGSLRGLATGVALLLAVAGMVLPIIGLWTLLGRRRLSLAVGLWVWSLLVWALMPTYFPGEKTEALLTGSRLVASPFGGQHSESFVDLAQSIAEFIDAPFAVFGPTSPPAEPIDAVTTTAMAIGEPNSERHDAVPTDDTAPTAKDEPQAAILATDGEGRSLRVSVGIEIDGQVTDIPLLFDTGATLTTLNSATLEQLGIAVPEHAPRATLQTAGGPVESVVVLIERLWLDNIPIENVSAAICDSCAQEDARGLLGLNATGLFEVTLRSSEREIQLIPTDLFGDRQLDVGHWLSLGSTATIKWNGGIEVEVVVDNSASVGVSEVVTEVGCVSRSFAVQLSSIPARSQRSTRASLPAGTDCSTYQVSLLSARW
tara:strand:- start:790 stop:1956 length:1167 start_codon:yes stop_codon:yes gene_type:complete